MNTYENAALEGAFKEVAELMPKPNLVKSSSKTTSSTIEISKKSNTETTEDSCTDLDIKLKTKNTMKADKEHEDSQRSG